MRPLPSSAALALVVLGGAASAAQGVVNADLGERAGNPVLGAVVNNLGGSLLVVLGLFAVPSMRAGLAVLRRSGLPWWSYLGGLGGAAIVVIGTYVVPVLGVAVFTIAQVAGGSVGGLAVDRAGLAPVGRLPFTLPRVAGALLGVGAVTLAQLGRPVGDLAVGLVLLAVAGGLAVALQSALNGRVSAASTTAAGIAVNFAVGTPVILAVAALVGAFATRPGWPGQWWLYGGGLLGVGIVLSLLVGVRAVGVLRTGLALVAGQLGGALLLDVLLPGGAGARLPVLAGAALTLVAVVVAGGRRRDRDRCGTGPEPGAGWQTGRVSDALVTVRPRRIRVVCWASAATLLVVFSLVATSLTGRTGDGYGTFQRGDQLAMIGLGVFGALGILLFTRPRVVADARGVRVRNVIGSYELPWEVVRGVRFDRGAPWASLELHDDDLLPMVALQAADKELAVEGVRALRRLHQAHLAALAGDPAPR